MSKTSPSLSRAQRGKRTQPSDHSNTGSQTPSSTGKQPVIRLMNSSPESPLSHRTFSNPRSAFVSSPIKKTTLPSPSPDRVLSKSSPMKDQRTEMRKRVMFTEALIHDPTQPMVPTPRKPILKHSTTTTTLNMRPPPHMQELTTATGKLSPNYNELTPDMSDYWSPGNIPLLSQPGLTDDLQGFRTLFSGGLTVLQSYECNKQFEIYATFVNLLKDLTDKRAYIVATYYKQLTEIIQRDVTKIECTIFGDQTPDPFLTRADVQIIKVCTMILSNARIQNYIHKIGFKMNDFVHWAVSHSCSVITRQETSKSLLTANLQLLKDQRSYPLIIPRIQEYILSSVMKMKYIQSGSLITEKLNTIKTLMINCTPMMEKNVKVWLPFLYNCLCDFSSPLYLKTIGTASIVLLESAKLFMTSKPVCFEVRSTMKDSIMKTLNIRPDSQLSIGSSPLDLSQSTLTYITLRLMEIRDQGNTKLALDIWLGLSVLLFSDPEFLKANLSTESMWFRILHTCLAMKDRESKELALKAWRVLVYTLCNALESLPRDNANTLMSLMLSVFFFDDQLLPAVEFATPLTNIFTQITYGLLNSVKLRDMHHTVVLCLIPILKKFIAYDSEEFVSFASRIFIHIISPQLVNKDYSFHIIKIMSSDPFDMRDIKPLPQLSLLNSHSTLFGFFKEEIWTNKEINYRTKSLILTSLMQRLKFNKNSDIGIDGIGKLTKIINAEYTMFFPRYAEQLNEIKEPEAKVEHVNKYIILLKTSFGMACVTKLSEKNDVVYLKGNIYISIVKEVMKYDVKTTEVLKYLLSHIKAYRLKFFEDLATDLNDRDINQYMTNNLESMIFEGFRDADALALSHTVKRIPKTNLLFKSFFIAISRAVAPTSYINELSLKTWSSEDIILLWSYCTTNFPSIINMILDAVSARLQDRDAGYAKVLLQYIVSELPIDVLPRFKEHFLFHAIDYHQEYTTEDNETLLELFAEYIDKTTSLSYFERDGILQHGITLCLSLLSSTSSETSLLVRVSRSLKYLIGHVDSIESMHSGVLQTMMLTTEKARSTFESVKFELIYELPLECLKVFEWPCPSDRSLEDKAEVMKDTLPIMNVTTASQEEDEIALKDTLPIVDDPQNISTTSHPASSSSSMVGSSDLSSSVLRDTLEIIVTDATDRAVESTTTEIETHEANEKDDNAEVQVFSSDKSANTSQESLGIHPTQVIEDVLKDVGDSISMNLLREEEVVDDGPGTEPTQVIEEVEEVEITTSPKISKSTSLELTERPLSNTSEGDLNTTEDLPIAIIAVNGDDVDGTREDHQIRSSPLPVTSELAVLEPDNHSVFSEDDSDVEVIEIDDEEFERIFSQKRRKKSLESTPEKRPRIGPLETGIEGDVSFVSPIMSYSSPIPQPKQVIEPVSTLVLQQPQQAADKIDTTTTSLRPSKSTFDTLSELIDGVTDEEVSLLDDKEVYEMENRLLSLMMKMRSRSKKC